MSIALREAREAAVARLEELASIAEERTLTEAEASDFEARTAEIADIDQRLDQVEAVAAARAAAPATPPAHPDDAAARAAAQPPAAAPMQVTERSEYAPDNPATSWVRDVATMRDRDARDADVNEARERLIRHYSAVSDEGGARAVRALSTTDSEGGYLVAPAHLNDQFLEIMRPGRPVADLCTKMPLPPKTDSLNIPKQSGSAAVAVHSQNGAVTETSMTFGTVTASVFRYAGMQTIPNFLLERSVPGIDQIALRDLAKELAVKVDQDIIYGAAAGDTAPEGVLLSDSIGTATYTATTATLAGLWPVLLNAITDVRSAHYGEPEFIAMHPRRWGWMLGQVDEDNKPAIGAHMPMNAVADHVGGAPQGHAGGPRIAGHILGIPVVLDSNIPVTLGDGTDEDRIIVGVFSEAFLYESTPRFAVSTENQFGKDQTIVRVTHDLAFTAERYPGAFSVVSGTGLNDTI
jgi:HK97 family phage major capsid protein